MIDTIMKAIDLSALAYLEPYEIEIGIGSEFYNFHWIENEETDTQVFICEDDTHKWVLFRGTEFDSFNDWVTNLNCSFTQGTWGEVHEGFWNDVESVRGGIIDHIDRNIRIGKKIIFAGHSLGAACAELFFSDLCGGMHNRGHMCIPIEPPRSMSKGAAKNFGRVHGSKIHHVVNNNDIVTRVPTRSMGYAHVENINLNYLDEDGNLHHEMSWWEMFKDRVKGYIFDFEEIGLDELGLDCIKDHSIHEVQRIWRKLL